MTVQLEERVEALERVLQSELPAQLRPAWTPFDYSYVVRLPQSDPREVVELRVVARPTGLHLRVQVNGAYTAWEREVFFREEAA